MVIVNAPLRADLFREKQRVWVLCMFPKWG